MTPRFSNRIVLALPVLAVTVFMFVGYAYASGNTLTSDKSGDGLSTVSGYVVENVTYNPSNDPSKIASVSLTLSAEAAWVKIQLTDTQSDWYDCTNTRANQWTCSANNAAISSVNQLRVAASGG